MLSRKPFHSLALWSIAVFPVHALAQWQGTDFFQPPTAAQGGSGGHLNQAPSAIELIKQEQAARQRSEQQRELQKQETQLSLEELHRQIIELQKKVALQESALRQVAEDSRPPARKTN